MVLIRTSFTQSVARAVPRRSYVGRLQTSQNPDPIVQRLSVRDLIAV
jgi:hypothetical protein